MTYQYNTRGWQSYEEREDWVASAWSSMYDITQTYDKDGNRTRYHKNVTAGQTANYGVSEDLGYTFNAVSFMTSIADADVAGYAASVTTDANGNITIITESEVSPGAMPWDPAAIVGTTFTYDDLNRMTQHNSTQNLSGTRTQSTGRDF